MNHQPLVSVISVLQSTSRFLSEAIQSVLAQTYTNWELLLVDDSSMPGGATLARQYAVEHPSKIRYLENSGQEKPRDERATQSGSSTGAR